MATDKYSFELKSRLSELKTLGRHLTYFARVNSLSETFISEINICLDELFTNIVLYGFRDDLEHIISFGLNMSNGAVIIHIEDNGIQFNPLLKKDPDLPADIDEAKMGGLGIHIVKKLMDDIAYERKRGGNRLTLKKFLHSANHLYKSVKSRTAPLNYPV